MPRHYTHPETKYVSTLLFVYTRSPTIGPYNHKTTPPPPPPPLIVLSILADLCAENHKTLLNRAEPLNHERGAHFSIVAKPSFTMYLCRCVRQSSLNGHLVIVNCVCVCLFVCVWQNNDQPRYIGLNVWLGQNRSRSVPHTQMIFDGGETAKCGWKWFKIFYFSSICKLLCSGNERRKASAYAYIV